jgi:hypothetical protein
MPDDMINEYINEQEGEPVPTGAVVFARRCSFAGAWRPTPGAAGAVSGWPPACQLS